MVKAVKICPTPECGKVVYAKGLCKRCYYRAYASSKRDPAKEKARYDRWKAANPGKPRDYMRRYHLRRKFGLTLEDEERMIRTQQGCAICTAWLAPGERHIDHDHETGNVRGLLCRACNTGIGMLGDSPHRLRRAIAYIEQGGYQGGWPDGYK